MCLGPYTTRTSAREPCPRQKRLDWTTARVSSRNSQGRLRFESRCILCYEQFKCYQIYRHYGIWDENKKDTISRCNLEGCNDVRLTRSLYCPRHVLLYTVGAHAKSHPPETRDSILGQISTKTWVVDRSSRFELFLQRQSLPPCRRFFALYLEGQLAARPPIVHQAAAVHME